MFIADMSTDKSRVKIPHGAAKPSPGPSAHVDSMFRKRPPQLPPPGCLQPETASLKRPPTEMN